MIFKQLLFIFFLLFILNNCKGSEDKSTTAAAMPSNEQKVASVLVEHPINHSFSTLLSISGSAKPNKQTKIYAMVGGYLKHSYVDIGDIVSKGQVLALLDNPELLSQKSKLEAELKGKAALYDRLKSIYVKTPQLTTVIDVEKAQAEYESIKAQLQSVELQIGYLKIYAPFSGVITSRYVDEGAIVQNAIGNANAMPLYEVQDIRPIRFSVEVPENDAPFITKGTKATITFPEIADYFVDVVVSRTAFSLNQTTKTMEIQLDIPNSDLKIKAGMYGKVKFARTDNKEALCVLNEAIANIKGESFVYVVKDGIVHKEIVKTGIRDEKYTQILSGNITLDDSVVISGKELCVDGLNVKVKSL